MNQPLVSKDRVDILKALAIVAVIFIHVISVGLQYTQLHTNTWSSLLTLDQVLRFCVPLFIALSGFGLAAKYSHETLNLKDFYLRRVTKIIPQYFFWSLVIYVSLLFIHKSTGEAVRFNLPQALLFGGADYHLYFVPLIFQFYLLFPLLFYITRKKAHLVFPFALILQIFIFSLISNKTEISGYNQLWSDQRQYIFFGSWLIYFILGIYLGLLKNVNKRQLQLVTLLSLIGTTVGLLWSITNTHHLANSGVDLQAVTRFTRLPVLLYSTSFIIFVLLVSNPLRSLFSLRKIIVQIGKNSYTTYLLHTLVLRIYILTLPFLVSKNFIILGTLITITSLVVSDMFNRTIKYGQNFVR